MRAAKAAVLAVLIAVAPATQIDAYSANQPPKADPCIKYAPLMRANGLPVKTFLRICYRESRGQSKAIGWNYHAGQSHKNCKLAPAKQYRKCKAVKSFDLGLFQINSSWVTVTAKVCRAKWGNIWVLLEPKCNAKVAGYLYNTGGLDHWKATSGAGT